MTTTQDRYNQAVGYVRRAIDSVSGSFWSSGPVDYYANREKTATARHDLDRLETQWWRASHDADRSRIARAAELLADRVKENLPGAPQDWRRTNLSRGEVEQSKAATTYRDELNDEANRAWVWTSERANDAGRALSTAAVLALLGGGLYVGSQLIQLLRGRQANRILLSLERAANEERRKPQ